MSALRSMHVTLRNSCEGQRISCDPLVKACEFIVRMSIRVVRMDLVLHISGLRELLVSR